MAKTTNQSIVTAVEGLTKATEALNVTANSILELVAGDTTEAPSKKPASKPAPKVEEDDSDELSGKTIQELRKIAKELGLKAGGSKESLLEAIRAKQSEEDADEEDEDEEEEEESDDDEDEVDLEELDEKELLSFIEENELGDAPAKKKKEKASDYEARLREFIENVLESMEDEDEEDDEDEEEDEDSDEEDEEELDLESMDVEDLLAVIEEAELEAPKRKKKEKDDAYAERLREFIQENLDEDEDEEEDEDEDTEDDEDGEDGEDELSPEDLEEMSDDELKELCEDFEIDFGNKFNRKKAIKAIIEYMESEDEEEE